MKKIIIILFLFAFLQSHYCIAQNNISNKKLELNENKKSLHNQTLKQISDLQNTISYQKVLIVIILVVVTIILIYLMLKLYSLNNKQRKFNIRLSQFRREKQELEDSLNSLSQDKEIFRNIINEINEGLIITDNQNIIIYSNNKVCELLNCPNDKIAGENLLNLFDENYSKIIKKRLLEAEDNSQVTFDIEFNSAQNEQYTYRFSAKKVFYDEDNSFAWGIVLSDVSEIRNTMSVLYDSEEKYFNIINNTSDGIVLVNSEGKIIDWNSGFANITGYNKSEVVNKYFWEIQSKLLGEEIIIEEQVQHSREYFNKIMDTGVPTEHLHKDRRIVNKNGEIKYINENVFTFDLKNSKVLCAIVRDVSERKKIIEELELNFNRFRELAELSPQAIFETDRTGLITYLNPIGYKKLGYKQKNSAVNIFCLQIFSSQDLIRLKKHLYQLIKYNKDIGIKEYTVLTKDGKEIPVLLHTQLMKKGNKIVGFRGIVFDISEQKRLENILKENEEKYRLLFDKAPYGLTLIRLKDSQILDLNQTICENFNLDRKHAIGMTVKEAGLFFDEEAASKMERELKSNGYFSNIVYKVKKPDGRTLTVSSSGNTITINNIPCLMIFTVDISDRVKYEKELLIKEEKYRTIFELIPGVVCLLDSNGKINEINGKIKDFLGYDPKELIDKHITEIDFVEEHSFGILKKNFAKRMLGKKVSPYEITLFHKDGTKRQALLLGDTSKGDDDLPIQDIIITIDITERKKIEEKLKEQTHLLESITDLAPMIISLTDYKKNKNIWCNKNVITELGYTADEYSKMTFDDIIDIIDKETFDRQKSLESFEKDLLEKGYWDSEIRIKDKSGNWKWFYNKSIPFKVSEERTIEQILKVSINIDRLKKTEEELILSKKELMEINRTKDKFFSIIAHDLRSPISSFLGLSQMLYDNFDDLKIDDIANSLKEMYESARVLYNLMENLLNWSRIQTGHIEFNPTEINLSDILNKDIEIFREISSKKKLKIINTVEDNLILNADYNMIYSVTRNLISNAIKYTNHNGSIVISARESENDFEISVSDTGVGMDKNTLDKLYKVDKISSTPGTDNEKGTGMGLIICKEFVEFHRGRIWVESDLGKGSVFTFTISKNL